MQSSSVSQVTECFEPGYTAVETRQVAYDADWGVAYEYDGRLNLAARTSGDADGPFLRGIAQTDYVDEGTTITATRTSSLAVKYDSFGRPQTFRTNYDFLEDESSGDLSLDYSVAYHDDTTSASSAVVSLDTPFADYDFDYDSEGLGRLDAMTVSFDDLPGTAPGDMTLSYEYLPGSGRTASMTAEQSGTAGLAVHTDVDQLGRLRSLSYLTASTASPLLRLDYEYGRMDNPTSDSLHLAGEYPFFIREMREWRAPDSPVLVNDAETTTVLVGGSQKTFGLHRRRAFVYDDLGRLAEERRYDGAGTLVREWDFALDIVDNLERLSRYDGDTATSSTAELALIDASHNQLESLGRAAYSTPGTVLLPVSGRVDADFETDHVDVWVTVKDAGNTILAEGPATLGAFAVSNPAAERQAAGWDALLEFDAPAADALLTVEVVTTARLAPAEPGYTAVETRQVAYDADWGVAYEYDGRLNLAARTSGDAGGTVARAEYAYDAMDRLVAADLPSGLRHEYVYDAMTRRLATRSGDGASTATAVHFYGPGWETLADLDADLAPRRVYVTAGGMDAQVAMLSPDGAGGWTTHYYLRDHLGSVLALVDATGAVAESYEYAPYGQPTILSIDGAGVRTVASSPSGNRLLYTGREWEPEAGYYHYRHRTYHPTDRRFMQADPIGLGGGWNHYAYVGGNPVMASDPMGLFKLDCPECSKEQWADIKKELMALQVNMQQAFQRINERNEKAKGDATGCTMEHGWERLAQYYMDFGFSSTQVLEWFENDKGPKIKFVVDPEKQGKIYGQYNDHWFSNSIEMRYLIVKQSDIDNIFSRTIVHELGHFAEDVGDCTPILENYYTSDGVYNIKRDTQAYDWAGGPWGYGAENLINPDFIQNKWIR